MRTSENQKIRKSEKYYQWIRFKRTSVTNTLYGIFTFEDKLEGKNCNFCNVQ